MAWDLGAIGGLVSAGSSIANTLFNRERQKSADSAAKNTMSNNNEMIDLARNRDDRLFQLATAPTTDARGSSTTYDPVKGWQTNLSERSKQMLDAGDQETLQQLTHDAGIRRQGLQANKFNRDEANKAMLPALSELSGTSPYSAKGIEGNLIQNRTMGLRRAYDDLADKVAIQGVRSSTDSGPILAEMARRMGDDYAMQLGSAGTDAMQMFENLESSRNARNLGKTGMLHGIASNIGDAPVNMPNIADTITSALADRSKAANTATIYGGAGVNDAYNNASKGNAYAAATLGADDNSISKLGAGIYGLLSYFDDPSGTKKRTIGNQTV